MLTPPTRVSASVRSPYGRPDLHSPIGTAATPMLIATVLQIPAPLPWALGAMRPPTLRCGIRTVGTGVSPARYAHRCRGGRPRSRARPHIPSRIAPSGFHTCGPRTAAGTHSVCTTSTSSPSPGYCHATSSYSAGWAFSISCWHGSHHPLPARSSPPAGTARFGTAIVGYTPNSQWESPPCSCS